MHLPILRAHTGGGQLETTKGGGTGLSRLALTQSEADVHLQGAAEPATSGQTNSVGRTAEVRAL